jgi:hypothetical protein
VITKPGMKLNATTSLATPLENEAVEKEEGLKDMWALFTQKNMLILYPLMMWCAISQATYMASFVPFMTLGMPDKWDNDK